MFHLVFSYVPFPFAFSFASRSWECHFHTARKGNLSGPVTGLQQSITVNVLLFLKKIQFLFATMGKPFPISSAGPQIWH